MARSKSGKGRKGKSSAGFIVSADKKPAVRVSPGMKLAVQSVRLLNPQLRPSKALGARLCGGTSTCLALIDIGTPASQGRGSK